MSGFSEGGYYLIGCYIKGHRSSGVAATGRRWMFCSRLGLADKDAEYIK